MQSDLGERQHNYKETELPEVGIPMEWKLTLSIFEVVVNDTVEHVEVFLVEVRSQLEAVIFDQGLDEGSKLLNSTVPSDQVDCLNHLGPLEGCWK